MANRNPNANDRALARYFLRGMRRFQKYVQAQEVSVTMTAEEIHERMDAAYQQARENLTVQRKKGE